MMTRRPCLSLALLATLHSLCVDIVCAPALFPRQNIRPGGGGAASPSGSTLRPTFGNPKVGRCKLLETCLERVLFQLSKLK